MELGTSIGTSSKTPTLYRTIILSATSAQADKLGEFFTVFKFQRLCFLFQSFVSV